MQRRSIQHGSLKKFQLDDLKITPQPTKKLSRRRAVINWLSVPAAEIEPWVSLGIIHRCDGFYRTSEIRPKVLGSALTYSFPTLSHQNCGTSVEIGNRLLSGHARSVNLSFLTCQKLPNSNF